MKKALFCIGLFLSTVLTSCTTGSYKNYRGCEYRFTKNIITSSGTITLPSGGKHEAIDTYAMIVDVINENEIDFLTIKVSDKVTKYIRKNGISEIKKARIEFFKDEDILFVSVPKMNIISKYLRSNK